MVLAACGTAASAALSPCGPGARLQWKRWARGLSQSSQLIRRHALPHSLASWQESDGPLVTAPTKKGFGSRLIERVWVGDFGGDVEIAYESSGVVCRLSAPMENLREGLPSALEESPGGGE